MTFESQRIGVLQVVSELLGWPQDVTLSLDPKVFEFKLFFFKKILISSLHYKNASPLSFSQKSYEGSLPNQLSPE
jgi:hypothetical protein